MNVWNYLTMMVVCLMIVALSFIGKMDVPESEPEQSLIMSAVSCSANEAKNQLKISCEATSWGRWEIFYVYDNEIVFKEADVYNDSVGVVFSTNPVELFVVYFDEGGEKNEVWLQIESTLKSCAPVNSCYIP
jgi:hypothetical protein